MSSAEGYTPAELAEWLSQVVATMSITGMDFALGGGAAVMVYGRRPRTQDVDLFVDGSPENWRAVDAIFETSGFRVERKSSWHKRVWRGRMYADLVLAEVVLQQEAVHAAQVHALAGVATRVIPPEHLVALKRVAGRPRDLRDIEDLREYVADLDDAKIAGLLVPYEISWP